MLTGLEATIAKTAASGATTVLAPGGKRLAASLKRRKMRRDLQAGAPIQAIADFLECLDIKTAQEITKFTASSELKSLSMGMATDILINRPSKTNKINRELKIQLRSLIALKTSISEADLDSCTELIFAALSDAVSNFITDVYDDASALPPASRASLLKVQDSYFDASVRNSEILSRLRSLDQFQTFEDQYRSQVRNLYGTMRLPHAGTTRRVPYRKLYVQPSVRPFADVNTSDSFHRTKFDISKLAKDNLRLVLLGDPGGGKSTLSLKMTYDCASRTSNPSQPSVPFLIVLRDYASELSERAISFAEYLEQQCKVAFSTPPPDDAIEYFLLNGRALVIFDGLDELLDIALRRRVVDAVTSFSHRYPSTPMLVTSRRVGYPDAPLDPEMFAAFTLCEFEPDQVAKYAENWFNLDESVDPQRRTDLCTSFLTDSLFVADLRVNPLMLSLMCGIYASEHYIPRNRPDVYEKCALLLFDSWDKQRGIKASLPFDAHVQAAMRSLALWLYPQQASQQGLPREKLIGYVKDYLTKKRFDNEEEAENAATEFIDFCKGRAWVLTDIGAELYGFTHRTFLEYFAASQIVRENTDPSRLFSYLEERLRTGGWEVVSQLALQILNKSVEDGADNFLEILLSFTAGDIESSLKAKLLGFAAQSLAYVVPRPPVLRELTGQVVSFYLSKNDDEKSSVADPLHLLLGAGSENLPLVSKYLYDFLDFLLNQSPLDSSALRLALYLDLIADEGIAHGGQGINSLNMDFWENQITENVSRFNSSILAQRELHPHVAIFLLEHGSCSAQNIISWHGAKAIFTPTIEMDTRLLGNFPICIRILLSETLPIGRQKITSGGTLMTGEQIEGLAEALLKATTPWHTQQGDSHLQRFIPYILTNLHVSSRRRVSNSALLLFLAAAYDLADESRDENITRNFRLNNSKEDTGISAGLRLISQRNSTIRNADSTALSPKPTSNSPLDEGGMRKILSAAALNERTIDVLQLWAFDPNFRLIMPTTRANRRAR